MFATHLTTITTSETTLKQTGDAGGEPAAVGNTREVAYDSKGSMGGGALQRHGQHRWLTVEVFDCVPEICSVFVFFFPSQNQSSAA